MIFFHNGTVGLDVHQEYTVNKKAGHTLKPDKSFSVDNFDDDLIS